MLVAVHAAQLAVATVVLAHGTWWTLLSVGALPRPRPRNNRARPPLSIVVIVPAHNEERLIASTLESLLEATHLYSGEIVVVGDNCTDQTAAIANRLGVTVIERHDASRRGKPFALAFALDYLERRSSPPDIVAVVDADTNVSPNFLEKVAERIAGGASAVQVHYAAGPAETDLGRLRRLAFLLVHWSRPLGASRLGIGTSLKGNGMAFSWPAARLGLSGTGITEDAESTLELARHGIAVRFEPGAVVHGYMAQTYREAGVQDERWEGGRTRLTLRAFRTAATNVRRGQIKTALSTLEVASLPLSLLGIGAGLSVVLGLAGFGSTTLAFAGLASLLTYVAAGLAAARAPLEDVRALVTAPRFLAHKARVYAAVLVSRTTSWDRTQRR